MSLPRPFPVRPFLPVRTLLILIIFFAFVTRIVRLEVPERYIFDEVYHAVTAKLIAHNDPRAFEWWNGAPEPETAVDWLHPPLAKYTQAAAMLLVGETSFGWRISSVLFGVGVIWLTYLLATEVFGDERLGLVAALLASLDGLLLTQSRIAMNDIHVTFFILLSLLWYWRYRQSRQVIAKGARRGEVVIQPKWLLLTGLGIGLAVSSKWSGFFVWVIVGLWEAGWWIQLARQWWPNLRFAKVVTHAWVVGQSLLVFILLPVVLYLASYSLMFAQGKSLWCFEERYIQGQCYFERWQDFDEHGQATTTRWEGYTSHFGELHRQIWWYQTSLTATHDYQSRPWQWFLNLRPVWFHVNYVSETQIANIYAQSNPFLAWTGALAVIITSVLLVQDGLVLMVTRLSAALKNRASSAVTAQRAQLVTASPSLFALLDESRVTAVGYILSAYLLVWVPWVLSPRIMFFYHYTPAVPLLCIIVAYWLSLFLQSKSRGLQYLAAGVLTLIIVGFVIWYPNWTAIPVSKEWADFFYFGIKSWK